MPRTFESKSDNVNGKFAVVVSRYNDNITGRLHDGALATLTAAGIAESDIQVAWVPGAWELPCLLYTSPSPRDQRGSRMPSSA